MVDINKALSEGSNSAGGYTVPEIWANKIYALMQEQSIMIPLCEGVNMTSDVWFAPTVTAGSTAYWVAELGTITASDLTFGQITLTAKKVAAKVQLSTELEEDSLVDIMKLVSNQMATDLALAIDSAIINSPASWTGMRFGNGNSVAASGANGDAMSVAKINTAIYEGQVDHFNYDVMICHPRVLKDLRALTDGNARPIFDVVTYDNPLYKTGVMGMVMGLQIKTSTEMPTTQRKGSAATLTDVLVIKSKKCGIFGKRRGMTAHKFYDIDTDSWYLQCNTRVAFAIPYANAICNIIDIQ
jgi:HK97 family phage major capsid protein